MGASGADSAHADKRPREGGASERPRRVAGEAGRALAGTGAGVTRRGEAAPARKSHTEPKPTGWHGHLPAAPATRRQGQGPRGGRVPPRRTLHSWCPVLLPRPIVHGPGGGGTRTRQGLADRGRLKRVPRAIRVRPTGRQQVQSRGPGHSCGHPAAGTTPRWIRGARASTAGRAQPNLPAASAHHARNGRQQCRP